MNTVISWNNNVNSRQNHVKYKFYDFGGHFENTQIRSLRRHFSACQHWYSDIKKETVHIHVYLF